MTPSHGRSGTWLSDETEFALFEEPQARGAFDIKALQSLGTIKFPVDDKDLWDILRLETCLAPAHGRIRCYCGQWLDSR